MKRKAFLVQWIDINHVSKEPQIYTKIMLAKYPMDIMNKYNDIRACDINEITHGGRSLSVETITKKTSIKTNAGN